ncbi:MAG: glycosyl hydrolase family 28 protein [Planctomycetota bacterium]
MRLGTTRRLITLSLLLVGWAARGGTARALTAYTATGDKAGGVFRVTVNGTGVPAVGFHGVHYAWFGLRGKARVTVEVGAEVKKASVWPARHGIEAKAEGRTVKFEIDCRVGRYLIVRVNDLEHLCLLIDPPEHLVAPAGGAGVVNVTRFMRGGAGADQTEAFRKAIAAANGTGKTVFVPRGVYTTGTVNIDKCRNMKVYLQPGCLLRSPVNYAEKTSGLRISDSQNITVFGRGTVDNTAWENIIRDKKDHKKINGSPLDIFRSRNVTVEGLTVRSARSYNCSLMESDAVTLRGCKAISPPQCNPEWTDGFNATSCRNLLIEDCFCYVNDDCFATGHNWPVNTRGSDNVTVRRLTGFNSRANGVRMGWDCTFNEGVFRFLQCDFLLPGAGNGIIIHQMKNGARYRRITFEECTFSGMARLQAMPLCIGAGWGTNGIHGKAPGARVDHLEFRSCSFDAVKPSVVAGAPGSGIGRLNVTDLTVAGKRCTRLEDASIKVENVGSVNVK